jgi:hypothetical protein
MLQLRLFFGLFKNMLQQLDIRKIDRLVASEIEQMDENRDGYGEKSV